MLYRRDGKIVERCLEASENTIFPSVNKEDRRHDGKNGRH